MLFRSLRVQQLFDALSIEAEPVAHDSDGALPIPCSFVEPRQGIKELLHAQVPVLPVLARPIVEELRVAQREACQERAASQACGLLELRQQLSIHLACEWFYLALCLLADRFDEAKVQNGWAVLLESQRIALDLQVGPLAWSVTTLKELAQLEQGSP